MLIGMARVGVSPQAALSMEVAGVCSHQGNQKALLNNTAGLRKCGHGS